MRFTRYTSLPFFCLAAVAVSVAHAGPVVTSYDITNAEYPGTGGWQWYYNGTVTPNGGLLNDTGGSGTLNDGVLGTSPANTELFRSSDNAVITGYLNGNYDLFNIALYSFDGLTYPGNFIPGVITGADVTIGGNTVFINASAPDANDTQWLDLTGSGLDTIGTTQFTISNVTVNEPLEYGNDWYGISEITVNNGTNGSVPDAASSLLLLAAGFGGMLLARKRLAAI